MQPYQIPAMPSAPQQFPGIPQAQPGAPQQFPGMPQAQPGAPQQFPGMPQAQPGAPQQFVGAPQQFPGMPQAQPGAPQQFPGMPQAQPGAPQQFVGAPQQFPGMPQAQPGAPQQFPGVPQAQPGAPQQPQIWTPAATLSPQMPVQAVRPVTTQQDPAKGLRVLIGPVVLSYPHLHEPAAAPGTQNKPKYSCDLYVYKSNPKFAVITKEVQEVIERVSQAVWRVNWPNGKNPPIMPLNSVRNGAFVAETGNDGWFLRTKSDSRPKCYVGQSRIEANADDMYAGAIVYASVTALPYDNQTGGKGIYWALNGVLKVADSVRLGGSGTGVEDFQNIPASEFNLATPEQYLDAQVFAGQPMPVF